jgi:hypothetical protein
VPDRRSIFISAARTGGSVISPLRIIEGYKRRWRLSAARRAGRGRYTNHWDISGDPDSDAERILAWVRETVACCRRPYGFACFDLALSLPDERGHARILQLERWEPGHLYGEGAQVVAQVRAFLSREAGRAAQGPVNVAAVLSSWGDLAHAVLSG